VSQSMNASLYMESGSSLSGFRLPTRAFGPAAAMAAVNAAWACAWVDSLDPLPVPVPVGVYGREQGCEKLLQ
jgi:hypothetical protein